MRKQNRLMPWSFVSILAALLLVGSASAAETPSSAAPAKPVEAAKAAAIRIDAGASAAFTDANGNAWLADEGFEGGDTIERGDVKIENTTNPAIYRSEHYSMNSFSRKVPNGKYVVKLHFAETFEEITAVGQRVFTVNVEGHELKDFDVFAKAGGAMRAYVETVNVEVTDGKLDITFTGKIENPEINGIEIIPAS